MYFILSFFCTDNLNLPQLHQRCNLICARRKFNCAEGTISRTLCVHIVPQVLILKTCGKCRRLQSSRTGPTCLSYRRSSRCQLSRRWGRCRYSLSICLLHRSSRRRRCRLCQPTARFRCTSLPYLRRIAAIQPSCPQRRSNR